MSRSQSEELIRQVRLLYGDYLQRQANRFEDVARMQDNLMAGTGISSSDAERYNHAIRQAQLQALRTVPEPVMSDRLIGLRNDLANTVRGDIYEMGIEEAPDLTAVKQSNAGGSIASIAGASAADALFQRVKAGKSSLAQALQNLNGLHQKGYDETLYAALQNDIHVNFPETKYIFPANPAAPALKEAMALRILLDDDIRDRTIDELYRDPPTEKGKEIAAIFIEHPRAIRNLPQSLWSGLRFVNGRKDWMERAAELQPELALKPEHREELKRLGFKDAVQGARSEEKERQEESTQHSSLI
ncbi:MAG: hypothetical protein U1E36_00145 [Rickettsiales bacterium]